MVRIATSLFLSGLILGVGPCLASCGVLLSSYIAARSRNYKQAFLDWLLFSAGRIFAYCALGVFAASIGVFLKKYISLLAGLFIVLIGLMVFFGVSPRVKLMKRINSAFTLGLTLGLIPCLPLVGIFSAIGMMSRNIAEGVLFSFIFGLGTLFSPLIFLALGAGFLERIAASLRARLVLRRLCALIIIFYGFLIILRGVPLGNVP